MSDSAVQDAGVDPKLMAIVVGVVTLVILAMFMSYNAGSKKAEATKSVSKAAPQSTSTSKAKKNKKKKAKAAAPAPAPEPIVEEKPEPTAASKKKKKKKNGGAAAAQQAPAPAPEPAPAPVSKSKKKKNKKAKVAPAASPAKPAPVTDDDDDDDSDDEFEQAALLVGMAKKGKGNNSTLKTSASSKPTAPVAVNKAKAVTKTDSDSQPEVVLDIGSDAALLIGPGGSTIQKITADSGAKLDILKNVPSFGLNRVRITADKGGSEDSISKAVEMVQAILDEQAAIVANSKTVTLSSGDINGKDGVKKIIGRKGETIQNILQTCNSQANGQLVKINANVDAGTVEISGPKVLVDKAAKLCKQAVFGEAQATIKLTSRSAMNIIFGKDFKMIRQLQDTTGARLDMDKEKLTLKLSGKQSEVDAARSQVLSLLSRCKGISMDIKASDVGAVYGKGGATIRAIQDKTGAFIEVAQGSTTNADGEATVKCNIMGEPGACAQALVSINKALAREVELKPGEIADSLTLGGAATAAVIGKGGSKVKELQSTHKVTINVNADVCQIIGKKADVEAAKAAIEAIIKPIRDAVEAQNQATKAAEAGDSAWQASAVPADEDGW
ncbi:MAG: hypothetical protein SGILL_003456 [Bacillariaceae sp.]